MAELRYDSRVTLASPSAGPPTAGRFTAPADRERGAGELLQIIEQVPVKEIGPLLPVTQDTLRLRIDAAPASVARPVSEEFAQGGFVQIVPENPADCPRLVDRLKRARDVVWEAHIAPHAVPAGLTLVEGTSTDSRNFEPAQGYLHDPPDGIGAVAVWNERGGKGQGVTVCDIEGAWNLKHEDLPPGIPVLGGTLVNDPAWRNHGTAVLGEMVSLPGNAGTVGVCHGAKAAVQAFVIDGRENVAAAIYNAATQLAVGDVLVIELQAPGPRGNYVAMQYWNENFLAIRIATRKGITVVEAAGNGGEDFDNAVYANSGLQKDAGAIVVGAGVPPSNYFDAHGDLVTNRPGYSIIGVPRSRIWFSNHGKIVSLQAWGWHVTTLGYGDAQGGRNENVWYTTRFRGTSSATPIIAGAAACLQGYAKATQNQPLPHRKVRSILRRSGVRQQNGPGAPVSQKIGPQPRLPQAFRLI